MAIVLNLLQKVNDRTDTVLRMVSPQLRKKAKVISVTAAVILTLLYATFQKVNKPPKALRHLPYVSRFSFLKYIFRNALYETYSKQLVMPLLKKESNGIYMVAIRKSSIKNADKQTKCLFSETSGIWLGCSPCQSFGCKTTFVQARYNIRQACISLID